GCGSGGGLRGAAPSCVGGGGGGPSFGFSPFLGWGGGAPAAAKAGRFGLDVTDFVHGVAGSTGASLCATWGRSSLSDPNRLRMKLLMLPAFAGRAGVPSDVHPARAIAAATTVDVRSARTGHRERSTSL